MKLKGKLAFLVTGLVAISSLGLSANAADGKAPTLTGFQVTPAQLDLASGPQRFTISGRVVDESGVNHIHFPCEVRRGETNRSIQAAISFSRSFPGGFAALMFGIGGFDTKHVKAKDISGNASDFTFRITFEIPQGANSMDCNWRYFASDELGNRYSMPFSESLGIRFQVRDSNGFQYGNPEFTVVAPTATPTPTPTPSGNSSESTNSRVREVRVSAPSTALPGTSLRIVFTFLDSNGGPVTDELVTLSNSGPGFFMNGGQQKPNAQGVISALLLIGVGDSGIVSVTAAAGIIKTTATVLVSTPAAPPVTMPNVVKAPTPTKYKNCAALQKVYAGGVALSSKSVNKGGKIKLKPTVNAKVYNLNKSLDRDKDGLACER